VINVVSAHVAVLEPGTAAAWWGAEWLVAYWPAHLPPSPFYQHHL